MRHNSDRSVDSYPSADSRGARSSLRGADESLVERAIEEVIALPGTRGFAGELSDGRLVRDVLGRYPLFVACDDPREWAFSPAKIEKPKSFPAGALAAEGAVETVWTLSALESEPFAFESDAVDAILAGIRRSFADLATEREGNDVAVAFSGGVDSAVVAANLDGPLYVVGFPDGHDVAGARAAAAVLEQELRVVELDHDDLREAVPAVARATGRTNAMDVAIALPLYLLAERVSADGFEHLALGQGADELFGGYEKVAHVDHRVAAETVRGAHREILGGLPDGLERDVLAIRAGGVEPEFPLLDDRLVESALRLDGELLVRDGVRKYAFREAAREFVPASIATREKKALQYGSLVSRELDRLARRAGYKRRMDDYVTKYVESLLETDS